MPLPPLRALAACVLALLGARLAPAQCTSWPGEPEPLPQVGAADEFAAGWARFRREELRGLALLLEASDPVEARRIWLHAACLAPGDAEISAALARTARPAVHSVEVGVGPAVPRVRRATLGGAFEVLTAEAHVEPPAPAPADIAAIDLAPIDLEIEAAQEHLGQARFKAAVELSDLARARLARLPASAPARERRVRVELLGATARLALGQDEEARTCVERALHENPDLVADPAVSPPKLQRLVNQARAQRAETTP